MAGKHTEFHKSFELKFWAHSDTGGTVAGTRDNAVRVDLTSGPLSNEISFRWPEQAGEVERVGWLLDRAFERGDAEARKQIRDVLGVRNARS